MKKTISTILSLLMGLSAFSQILPAVELKFTNGSLTNTGWKGGNAYYMGGSSAQGNTVNLTGTKGVKVGFGSSLYGMSVYFKPNSTISASSAGAAVFATKSGPGINGVYLGSVTSFVSDEIVTVIKNTNSGTADRLSCVNTPSNIASGAWHHLVLAYNSSTSTYDVYVDGLKRTSVPKNNGHAPLLTSYMDTLTFGIRTDNLYGFNGQMDEIKLYSDPLSASDISDLDAEFQNYQNPEPLVHLNFESGLANTGTLGGAANIINQTQITTNFTRNCAYMDGTSGLKINYNNHAVYALSAYIKPEVFFQRDSNPQVLFGGNDGPNDWFGEYIGNIGSGITGEMFSTIKNSSTGSLQAADYTNKVNSLSVKWHHLLFIWDGSKYDIYLDGVEATTLTGYSLNNATLITTNTDTLQLGLSYNLLNGFKGYMDDIKIWGDQISTAQITSLLSEFNTNNSIQPSVSLQFNNNLDNNGEIPVDGLGFNGEQYSGCDNPALLCNGSNGSIIKYNEYLQALNIMFKPAAAITSATSGQALISSTEGPGKYGIYLGNIGAGLTNEVISLVQNANGTTPDRAMYYASSSATILPEWNHLVIYYSAGLGTYKMVLNGTTLTTTTAYNGTPALIAPDTLVIGNRADNNYSFDGLIDDVRLYNVSLAENISYYITGSVLANFLTTQTSTTVVNAEKCPAGLYFAAGQYQANAGTYYDTTAVVINGCKQVIKTILTNTTAITGGTSVVKVCQGDSVLIGGVYQTMPGTYSDTLTAINGGCDSILSVVLSNYTIDTGYVNVTICSGSTHQLPDGQVATTDGTYYSTIPSQMGCDSTVVTNLTTSNTVTYSAIVTICQGDSVMLQGAYQTQSGVYSDTTVIGGCDSIMVTTLTVLPTSSSVLNTSICQGQTYVTPLQNVLTQTGTYTEIVPAVNGCDSVITINLTVNATPAVSFAFTDSVVCNTTAAITLIATPSNASISGDGVVGNTFYPGNVSLIPNQVIASVINNTTGCVGRDTAIITVENCTGNVDMIACYNLNGNLSESINGLTGTMLGNSTIIADHNSNVNSAISLNNGAGNGIAVYGADAKVNSSIGNGITISAWIKPSTFMASAQGAIVSKWNNTLAGDQFILMYDGPSGGKILFAIGNGTNSANGVSTTATVPQSAWTHVAATWAPGGAHKIYINGSLVTSQVLSTFNTIKTNGTVNMMIGAQSQTFRNFGGGIDDVKLYGSTLSAQAISELFNYSPNCPNVTGVNNIEEGFVALYPNPARDRFVVECATGIETKVEVLTMDGRTLTTGSMYGTSEYSINDLSAGMYLIRVSNLYTTQTIKLVKE